MRVGLYFGSFNPIHIGHLILANTILQKAQLNEVWFVITPQSPHKKKEGLLDNIHRLALVKEAIQNDERFKASDIEFKMEAPFYTVNTLTSLKEKYSKYTFELILGEDNLRSLNKWYNYEYLIANYSIWVYPRVETIQEQQLDESIEIPKEILENENIKLLKNVPLMKISASYIREAIKNKQDVRYLLPPEVVKYIDEMNFYK